MALLLYGVPAELGIIKFGPIKNEFIANNAFNINQVTLYLLVLCIGLDRVIINKRLKNIPSPTTSPKITNNKINKGFFEKIPLGFAVIVMTIGAVLIIGVLLLLIAFMIHPPTNIGA